MGLFKEKYQQEVIPAMRKRFAYGNVMEIPRLKKVVVNMGLGEAVQNVKILESAVAEMAAITGRKPVITKARKSIAQFKLREGMPIGCMVTLRRDAMYEFLERLVTVTLPRVRDFKGISGKAFDGRGNYSLGFRDQLVFPEIELENVDKIKGMNIAVVTSAKNDEEGRELLSLFGFPFRK
ncbi:MAG: 50S ribosomal protein L5 [Deltaproteobacteria bacterium]|nr:50S ribosomal protein L5 [Deltaproteobacteria bacterium]